MGGRRIVAMIRDLYTLLSVFAIVMAMLLCASPSVQNVDTYTDVPTNATDTPFPMLVVETENAASTPPLPTAISETLTPTRTPTGTPTPQRTRTPTPTPLPYSVTSISTRSDIYGGGCQWMGIAGQVFGNDNLPIWGIIVRLNGGGYKNIDRFTGSDNEYGEGGYEFFLHTPVVEETYTIQLFRSDGIVLSAPVVVKTTADCKNNLYVVNFHGSGGHGGAP